MAELVRSFPGTPPPLASALRSIARELDARPQNSPLWGRFLQGLALALEAEARQRALAPEVVAALWELRTSCERPEEHAEARFVHCGQCCPVPRAP